MSADAATFRLVCTPPNSFSPRGFRVLVWLLCGAAGVGAAVFAAVGAWPVAGFLGIEVVLAAWLIARHARHAAAAREEVAMEAGRLVVRARDARGRESRVEMEPYWARLERRADGRLVLVSRGVRAEVGRFLPDEERAEFGRALERALAGHRSRV